jgi:hypothetical protein
MVLSSKGQFFLVGLVAMAIIVTGMAYFASESKELSRLAKMPQEKAMETELDQYEAILMQALETRIYENNWSFVQYAINKSKLQANKTWRNLTAECLEDFNGLDFMLNCTLILESETQNISRTFNNTYTVPINITLYSDPNLATENSTFRRGDVIYYKVTGEQFEHYNVSFMDPWGNLDSNHDFWLSDYHENSSYTIPGWATYGTWNVYLNRWWDPIGSPAATFNVTDAYVVVETFDEWWVSKVAFNKGDMVRVNVTVWGWNWGFAPPVKVDVVDAWGRRTDYGSQGTISSMNYHTSFTIDSTESSGTMTVSATEQEQFVSNSTLITVL